MGDDLDDILDDALNDFDRTEPQPKPAIAAAPPSSLQSTSNAGPVASSPQQQQLPGGKLDVGEFLKFLEEEAKSGGKEEGAPNPDEMKALMHLLSDEATRKEFEKLMSGGFPGFGPPSSSPSSLSPSSSSSLSSSSSSSSSSSQPQSFEQTVDMATKMIAQGTSDVKSDPEAGKLLQQMGLGEAAMDDMLESLMKEFSAGEGEGGGPSDVAGVEGMVEKMFEKMLTKEHFYEPMREITEKYPAWLKENKKKISKEEHTRYKKQYECFKKICKCYEKDPPDTKQVLELMKEVQDYGQPPAEIVKDMAPEGEGGDPNDEQLKAMLSGNNCPTM